MSQVMLVDAVSSAEDVKAIRSIIQRGISVVSAAEATSLTCLMNNPELRMLVDMSQRDALYAARRCDSNPILHLCLLCYCLFRHHILFCLY
jgi:stage III sporulation protein SpoIIIAA